MFRFYFISFFLLLVVVQAPAQEQVGLRTRADKLFQSGEYAHAASAYLNLLTAEIFYSALGRSTNNGPFGDEKYRSLPVKASVTVLDCGAIINPHIKSQ